MSKRMLWIWTIIFIIIGGAAVTPIALVSSENIYARVALPLVMGIFAGTMIYKGMEKYVDK